MPSRDVQKCFTCAKQNMTTRETCLTLTVLSDLVFYY